MRNPMRSLLALFSSLLFSCFVVAQDPGMQAAQAAQQAIQANQQALEANRQANEAARQAIQNSLNTPADPCCFYDTAQPQFSVKPRNAEIGEKIPMLLTEDLQLANTLVKKGASATATVTAVDRTGAAGAPGAISFEVDSLQTEAGPLALRGGATREGSAKPPNAAVLIPVVGPLTLFKHGTDAVIAKGTPFIAFLKAVIQ